MTTETNHIGGQNERILFLIMISIMVYFLINSCKQWEQTQREYNEAKYEKRDSNEIIKKDTLP